MFVRGLGRDLTPALRDRLRAAGLDLDQPLKAEYPADEVRGWFAVVRAALYPGVPQAEADERLGRQLVRGYRDTLLGKATLQILKLLGPRRVVRRINDNLRQLNNFSQGEWEARGPGEAHYLITEPSISPEFTRGNLLELMESLGTQQVRVDPLPHGGSGYLFRVRWTGGW